MDFHYASIFRFGVLKVIMPLLKSKERYSYQDYITWGDDERWEIIDGVAYNMAPAPRLNHQDVVLSFGSLLKSKRCKSFIAPMDVILSEHDVLPPDGKYELTAVFEPEQSIVLRSLEGIEIPLSEMIDVDVTHTENSPVQPGQKH